MLNARSQTSAGREGWTFTPAVSIEALPYQEQERARTVYAAVTREREADILRATEDTWSSYQSRFGFTMPSGLSASLKQEWLAREYVDIVSIFVFGEIQISFSQWVVIGEEKHRRNLFVK